MSTAIDTILAHCTCAANGELGNKIAFDTADFMEFIMDYYFTVIIYMFPH